MDALVRRYGQNEMLDDESDILFTNDVLWTPFLERFKMPYIKPFKKNTDPKERVRRRNHSGEKVSEIRSANDEVIISAFINNLQNGRLYFDLRRARLTSYADMIDMAGGYTLAEEEEIVTGGSFMHRGRPEEAKSKDNRRKTQKEETHKGDKQKSKAQSGHRDNDQKGDRTSSKFQGKYTKYTPLKKKQEEVLKILEEKNMSKEPPRQSKYTRRVTTKYCHFRKEKGHETFKCFQLKAHIETLIREGHLKDIIFKKVDDQPHRDNH
ncbi:hypothetical protein Dsin_005312 [Dipteronia sinensis]|uniref:Uncharacterized protein n=1 Tax=Dipteronia sinensis TaxID=43782 RepID=A0AAE0AX77_9ROSI|nr:hypothetical protein Dsin_005312 [Dipteronia sinensis]